MYYRTEYFTIFEARELISTYVKNTNLEQNAKKGFIKADPFIA